MMSSLEAKIDEKAFKKCWWKNVRVPRSMITIETVEEPYTVIQQYEERGATYKAEVNESIYWRRVTTREAKKASRRRDVPKEIANVFAEPQNYVTDEAVDKINYSIEKLNDILVNRAVSSRNLDRLPAGGVEDIPINYIFHFGGKSYDVVNWPYVREDGEGKLIYLDLSKIPDKYLYKVNTCIYIPYFVRIEEA